MQVLFVHFFRDLCLYWCQSSFVTGKLFLQPLQVPVVIWNYHFHFWKYSFSCDRSCWCSQIYALSLNLKWNTTNRRNMQNFQKRPIISVSAILAAMAILILSSSSRPISSVYTVPGKKEANSFLWITFNKCRCSFIIFGTNHLEDSLY